MTLIAHVYGRLLRVTRCFPRRDECIDAGRRTPTCKKPSRTLRVTNPAPKPVYDHKLKLAWPARNQPSTGVDVVPG